MKGAEFACGLLQLIGGVLERGSHFLHLAALRNERTQEGGFHFLLNPPRQLFGIHLPPAVADRFVEFLAAVAAASATCRVFSQTARVSLVTSA